MNAIRHNSTYRDLFQQLFGTPVPVVDVKDVQARLNSARPPLLLDVRQPREYRSGHIAESRLVPLAELARRAAALPHDREVICICRTGRRSRAAARQLSRFGLKSFNLEGGMAAWYRAGLPVQKGSRS